MKKVAQILAIVLIVAMLVVPAYADFTPSVQQKGAPTATVENKKVVVTTALDKNADAEVVKTLEEAIASIESAKSLEEAAPALADTLKAIDPEAKIENFVVRDICHVNVEGAEGETAVSFDLGVNADDVVVVMQYVDGKWIPVDSANVTVNKDGSVTVKFDGNPGVIAFVVESK